MNRKEFEPELFNIVLRKQGLELFDSICDFIEGEIKKTEQECAGAKYNFIVKMLSIWNNAGWDEKKDHSRKLEIIFKEQRKVSEEMDRLGMDQ